MELDEHKVHVWLANLTAQNSAEEGYLSFLSEDEIKRANRFHFAIHKRRFIVARATLRKLLSLYLACPPEIIQFGYGTHHKPKVIEPKTNIYFNLSHSEDMALFAFTLNHELGIDIEKVSDRHDPEIAERYFSPEENKILQLSGNKLTDFYRLWTRKEALIKALGEGLSVPLNSFSVNLKDKSTQILYDNTTWQLLPLQAPEGYEAALACHVSVDTVSFWEWLENEDKRFIETITAH